MCSLAIRCKLIFTETEWVDDDDDDDELAQGGSAANSAASAPAGEPPAASQVSVQLSKGKHRARAQTLSTTLKGTGKKVLKEPHKVKTKNGVYLVNYISTAEDPNRQTWGENKFVCEIHRMKEGDRLCVSQLVSALQVILRILDLVVIDIKALKKLAGKKVPQNAVTIFLNVSNNWLGKAKKLCGLLDAFGDSKDIKKYLKSVRKLSVGLNQLLEKVEELIHRDSAEEESWPKKRQRRAGPSQENEEAPSNFQDDYHRARGEYHDPSEEDEPLEDEPLEDEPSEEGGTE